MRVRAYPQWHGLDASGVQSQIVLARYGRMGESGHEIIVDREMRASDSYWRAYEEWKKLPKDLGGSIDASKRMTREEAHERRRR